MGWISPTGFVDSGGTWVSESLAYDEATGTYSYSDLGVVGWSNWIEYTVPAINCDKVQLWLSRSTGNITEDEIEVYYSGGWHNIHSGIITVDQWVEYQIGSTESVTALRVRMYTDKKSRQCRFCEADFWEVVAGPTPNAYNQIAYTSEPPTPNAWNQIKQEVGSGWIKINYEGE